LYQLNESIQHPRSSAVADRPRVLRVIEHLVTHGHSRSFEMTPLVRACVSLY